MPRRKRGAGDIDDSTISPQTERMTERRTSLISSTTPRKSKRTRIISPASINLPGYEINDSASSPDEETAHSPDTSICLPSTEHDAEHEPESSIPPHIRRLIKGKQVQRYASSGSGFIDMTSHPQQSPVDSDTDESSFWSAGDTSFSSTSSALLSDTSMSVRMDVVRFDWPSSSANHLSGYAKQPSHEIQNQRIHRIRSAPNLSPDRFIQHHSMEDDTLLHRSTRSTPRSVRLARHLGFVVGNVPSVSSSEEKFEERLRRARTQSNVSMAEETMEESISFVRRAMRAGAGVELEEPSAGPSTRLGTPSTRPTSPTRPPESPFASRIRDTLTAAPRDASPNPFNLHHSASEPSLYHTASWSSLGSSTPFRSSNLETSFRASTTAPSTPETSLRQLPHERALLSRSASALLHTSTVGASGAAMNFAMEARGKRRGTDGKPSPSSRYYMQRAPIHVYDAPEILEDYYASPFAWNHSTQDQFFAPHTSNNTRKFPSLGVTSASLGNSCPGGMLACALGTSVFFSRVSGSQMLCIERLYPVGPGSSMQSAVEWGTHAGGWDHALAVGQTRGGLSIWDAQTKQHMVALRSSDSGHHSAHLSSPGAPSPSQVCAISWNRNSIAAGFTGCALLWDIRCAPRIAKESELGHAGQALRLGAHGAHKVCGVKWREDGEMLATGGDDNTVCVWDIRMPRKPVVSSASDGTVAGGANAATPVRQTPLWRKRSHTGAVKALAWCPWAPNVLASGGGKQDGTVCFWNVQTGTLKDTLTLGSQVTSIAFSPVCREFVTTHGFRAATPPLSSNPPQPARFQTYDPHLPSSDTDSASPPLQDTANSIVTHSYPSLARVAHVPNLHGMRISHASLSPDGSRLMTGGTFEALVMWSVWGAIAKEVEEGIESAIGLIR